MLCSYKKRKTENSWCQTEMQNLLNIYNHKEFLELLPEHDKIGKACP